MLPRCGYACCAGWCRCSGYWLIMGVSNFSDVFICLCICVYGSTILPDKNVGGTAGGEKYIYHGILFKFAESPECIEIYGSAEVAILFCHCYVIFPMLVVVM